MAASSLRSSRATVPHVHHHCHEKGPSSHATPGHAHSHQWAIIPALAVVCPTWSLFFPLSLCSTPRISRCSVVAHLGIAESAARSGWFAAPALRTAPRKNLQGMLDCTHRTHREGDSQCSHCPPHCAAQHTALSSTAGWEYSALGRVDAQAGGGSL